MQALERVSRARFVRKICDVIRTEHADLTGEVPDAELRDRVAQSCELADRYRLLIEADVYEFCVLCLVLGTDWLQVPEHQWAHAILSKTAERADIRLFQIREQLQAAAGDGE